MGLNSAMLARRLRRLVHGRPQPLHTLASHIETLCPAEVLEAPAARHLPGALEKVTALSPWRNWDAEHALIRGGPTEHAASTLHVVDNVQVVDAHLYSGSAKAQPGYGAERWWLDGSVETEALDEAHLVTSQEGSHFFGPFLQCDLPLELIRPSDPRNRTMPTKPYGHAAAYRELLGLPPVPTMRRARVRRLTMFVDFAQNSHKIARYRQLRAALRERVPQAAHALRVGVYLQRGSTGEPRILSNEAQVIEFLAARGFDIVEPARLGAADIAARTLDAPLVVSVEGSHLSHVIYSMAERGTMLVLQPPDRFAMPYKEYTDALGMGFAFVVGDAAQGGFSVNLDELAATLELVA
ncbi:MAG: glycosyltransferase family 61 protein [Steroidobacteraceae bacterium]